MHEERGEAQDCPHCRQLQPLPRRSWLARFGLRELLVCGAGLGLLLGFGWVDDQSSCRQLDADADAVEDRDAALEDFIAERCGAEGRDCEGVELRGVKDCAAKLELRERRRDSYGEVTGTFDAVLGLRYRPSIERWQLETVLEDKQVLGLASHGPRRHP